VTGVQLLTKVPSLALLYDNYLPLQNMLPPKFPKKIRSEFAIPALLTRGVPAAPPGTSLDICVVHNNADRPSITGIINAMNDDGACYNAKIASFDPALGPQNQVSIIENCTAQKRQVFVLNAADPATVVPAIKRPEQAGIPVIMMGKS
jgi:ABC-type sugar transport system substrate-binding protein